MSDFNPVGIGRIRFPFQLTLRYLSPSYNEETVRFYWGFIEGSERFTPRNPQAIPSLHRTNDSKIIQLDCSLDEAVISIKNIVPATYKHVE